MRSLITPLCAVAFSLLAVRPSHSDETEAPLLDAPPLWEHPPSRSPFEAYHPGPTWAYEELTTAERAVVDHGRNRTQAEVHAGYNLAVQRLATRAANEAAAIHLGLENRVQRASLMIG